MERWSSSWGFLLAAIGSAVGIGNIWRFPAIVGQNGGGAYLVPYLIAVFVFALPLMILELSYGRQFRGSVVHVFQQIRPGFQVIGWLTCCIVLLILSYYLVITGWTLAYCWYSVQGDTPAFDLFTTTYFPILFFLLAAFLTGFIVSRGVREGIERISKVLIPFCFIMLVVLVLMGTTLSGFDEGMMYLFSPDFSALADPVLWSAAFGQAFFSLSVGMGILLTYGAYMEKDQDIPRLSVIIVIADLTAALLAGLVIFPLVFTFGLEPAAGAELAFSSLLLAFSRIPAGHFFAVAFFLTLFIAAITSGISMLEVGVAAADESFGWSRNRSAAVITAILILIGLPSALSYSPAGTMLLGFRVLDLMDETVGTLGLPIVAVLMAAIFCWAVPEEKVPRELSSRQGLSGWVFPLCKYVIPPLLIVATAARVLTGPGFYGGSPFIPEGQIIGAALRAEGIIIILFAILIVSILLCRFRKCRIPGLMRKE
jgi:NSS family neurotransmitter:Na+ symporter